MTKKLDDTRDQILIALLKTVAGEGWSMVQARAAAESCGFDDDVARTAFPGGLDDILAHFSDYLDRAMLMRLGKLPPPKSRIRDRIETAVMTRFECAEPHKDALRLALAYWSVPPRAFCAGRLVWRTADRMWTWAGDTATDYNHYTKRGLLSGVITTTTLVWLKDTSPNYASTRTFLANRIENVLQLGQMIGKFKQPHQAS
jgi:ubiquinone biosynthesis protein COQ9